MNGLYDQVRLVLHGIWRRRWLALAVAWGLALAGWLGVSLIPNSYESRARVFVDMQSLLPSKVGITGAEQQQGVDRVRSTLLSSENLQQVVRGTDMVTQVRSDADLAAAVTTLRNAITIKAGIDNVVEITARLSVGGLSDRQNAGLARATVGKLIDLFVEGNLTGDRDETNQTMGFLDAELARREGALQEAEAKRAAFEQKYMGMLPGSGSIAERLEQSRSELEQVSTDLMAAQGSLSALAGQMGSTPATIAVAGPGGAVGGARGRIATLEGQIADGQARGWTDQHPDMMAARAQITRLRGQAASEPTGGGGSSTANPMYVTLRSMQAEKQATVAALGARRAQLQSDMAAFAAKQAQAPDVAAEQARLSRDYDVMKAQYDKLLQDREDIRLRTDVNSKTDAVKFRVIDPPSLPRLPAAPNRPILLIAVLIAAVGAGIGVAFALGQVRATYPTTDRLAVASGLPVLGGISEVVTPPLAAQRRQRLVWFAGGTGGLAACCLLLLVIEFVQRGLVA